MRNLLTVNRMPKKETSFSLFEKKGQYIFICGKQDNKQQLLTLNQQGQNLNEALNVKKKAFYYVR